MPGSKITPCIGETIMYRNYGNSRKKCPSTMSPLPVFVLLALLSIPAGAGIRLYSREKADSLKTVDSLRHTDSRWISDSIVKARYFASDAKKHTGIRLYSRSQIEKKTVDSTRIIDSLRVADSIRIADSVTISRYRTADGTLNDEKKAGAAAAAAATVPSPPEPSGPSVAAPKYSENLSARFITIAPDNPYAPTIDSLQAVIDHLSDSLHDGDPYFRKMKVFPVSEKQRYIAFLLENRLKDSAQVLAYCTSVFELYKIKQSLLVAIRNSQDVNTKSFISGHIDEHMRKMGELSELLLTLTPKVPFAPVRNATAGSAGE